MTRYAREQGEDGMDQDLIPWLEREWSVDITLSEFPYFEYIGPEDSREVRERLTMYGCDNIWTLPDHLRESPPYRTDVVAVRVDHRALERRERETGNRHTLITTEGWGQPQPRLRTFLNFRRDGPMTREYYLKDHGLFGEPNAMNEGDSGRTFQWLADMGFLTDTPGVEGWEAADILTLFGAVHAIELKREPGEWRTALEQASRADCYADFRWVAMSDPTADRALANTNALQSEGVGLMTVSSSGVTVHVDADRCTRAEDADLLSRPYCERWDLNERVMKRVTESE